MPQALLLLASLLIFSNVAHCDFSPTIIADMAKILMDNYCSPEKLSGMEEAIDAASSNTEILSISDPASLAIVLTDGVKQTLFDSRVQVTYEPGFVPVQPPAMPDIPPEQLAEMIKGTVKVEVLDDNIGYLKIQHIIGEDMAQKVGPVLLEYIWDKILPTSAMILDFRSAVSGELSGIPYIVSYYTDPEPLIHIDSVYDRTSDVTIELWSMPTLLGKRAGRSVEWHQMLKLLQKMPLTLQLQSLNSVLKSQGWFKRQPHWLQTTMHFRASGTMLLKSWELLRLVGNTTLISTKEELEAKLSADLLKLSGDKCLKATSNIPALPPNIPTPEMFIELIKVSFHTDIFENNIGYLRFDMFGDFEHVAKIIAEHVWNKVVDTVALIVDLRNNVGGSTSSIAGFCSYFFDDDKQIVLDHVYDRPSNTTRDLLTLTQLTGKRYGSKKSVIVLTSGVTAGAAEEFVFIMKRLGRAMIIGETTHGGCHPPETFSVGESNIFLSVPISHSDTAQGPAWEGAGIAPHIPVPADAALDSAKSILNKHFSGQK
ncbi:hypothetical protein G5714_012971 [Onychostoma macrolepis]|uniref:Tail specific protease domain-containing protein n=1 Tax=Onychostoma macrolepis TaxID=369639 RepID=A0A7J6CIJ4_9TELE|nr:hypothetical protein G5714_012971 [Onychostoma macrolepis]